MWKYVFMISKLELKLLGEPLPEENEEPEPPAVAEAEEKSAGLHCPSLTLPDNVS